MPHTDDLGLISKTIPRVTIIPSTTVVLPQYTFLVYLEDRICLVSITLYAVVQ